MAQIFSIARNKTIIWSIVAVQGAQIEKEKQGEEESLTICTMALLLSYNIIA